MTKQAFWRGDGEAPQITSDSPSLLSLILVLLEGTTVRRSCVVGRRLRGRLCRAEPGWGVLCLALVQGSPHRRAGVGCEPVRRWAGSWWSSSLLQRLCPDPVLSTLGGCIGWRCSRSGSVGLCRRCVCGGGVVPCPRWEPARGLLVRQRWFWPRIFARAG